MRTRPAPSGRARADGELFDRLADEHDPVDREALVERFLPLARSIASRYLRRGEQFDDIFQVASLALLHAIDRYDPSRGQAFSSYALPTIAGEIKRHYRDRTWTVHVPRDLQDLSLSVDRAVGEAEHELGRSPTVPEIADRLAIEDAAVLEALQARHAHSAVSLDAPVHDDDDSGATVGSRLGADEQGFALAELRADIRTLEEVLTPRERTVVNLRFFADLTQKDIGDRVGLSQMQISRILRASIAQLRAHAQPSVALRS